MEQLISDHLDEHFDMADEMRARAGGLKPLAEDMWTRLRAGGCLLAFGNGGSAAEAQHFSGELLGRFKTNRRPLPAVALPADPATMSCIANDFHYDDVFARPIAALAREDSVVFGFTTSGRSANVIAALEAGRRAGAMTVMFTGANGAEEAARWDHAFVAPTTSTARIQEMHQFAMHVLCAMFDEWAEAEDAKHG